MAFQALHGWTSGYVNARQRERYVMRDDQYGHGWMPLMIAGDREW